jgi:hypothetical protein
MCLYPRRFCSNSAAPLPSETSTPDRAHHPIAVIVMVEVDAQVTNMEAKKARISDAERKND